MSTYSTYRFREDWRYGLKTDFKTDQGENYPYAPVDGHVEWGSEKFYYAFNTENVGHLAMNHDKSLIAVAVDREIHIFDTTTWQVVQVVRGHPANVLSLAFQPSDSNVLVSSSFINDNRLKLTEEYLTVVWDLKHAGARQLSLSQVQSMTEEVTQNALESISHTLADKHDPVDAAVLSADEKSHLGPLFRKHIQELLIARNLQNNLIIPGQLYSRFYAPVFSPSGRWLTYMPMDGPKIHPRHDARTIYVYCLSSQSVAAVLPGHTNSVMWVGFDSAEKYIGTTSWDRTIRIWCWDGTAKNGQMLQPKYQFDTDGQNWLGAFSPCSKYFAATVDTGKVHVYDLDDGSSVISYDFKGNWYRSLVWLSPSPHAADNRPRFCVGTATGSIMLLGLDQQEPQQTRSLAFENTINYQSIRAFLLQATWVTRLMALDDGLTLVSMMFGDCGVEIHDLARQIKWRIARGGVDLDLPKAKQGILDAVQAGEFECWRVHDGTKLCLAVLATDGLRVWYL